MLGIYYKTLSRDWDTGETVFLITPKEVCTYATNGLLKCSGKVGVYTKGIPLEIDGKYDNKTGLFCVTSDTLTVTTEEGTIELLDYITDNLTETQKKKICELAENDLFSFVEKDNVADLFMNEIFKSSKKAGRLTKLILRTMNGLKEHEMMTKELMSYGFSIDRIETLFKKELTLSDLDKSPYKIMLKFEVPIDVIEIYAYNRLKTKEYSIMRLCGFLLDSMFYLSKMGDTCSTLKKLTETMNMRMQYHGAYPTVVDEALVNLCISIMTEEVAYREINGIPYIYLKHIWEEETIAVSHMKRLQTGKKQYQYPKYSIADAEKKIGITYNKEQRKVFDALLTSGVKILTGPPGSGKTAVIRGLMEYFTSNDNGVVRLAATTGMAAKVMSQSCNEDAETANLMLDVRPFDSSVKGRDLNNPVEGDLIIVDEVSMLGLQLFSVLVRAIKNGCILLLVGDVDQLQSVDYGNVLHDLIDSGCVEVYRLTEILRQSGTICTNAQKINRGQHRLEQDNTFTINKCDDSVALMDILKKKFKKNDAQILCPIKNGDLSTFTLNTIFQDTGATFAASYGKKIFRIGDKVIMTKTNYDKNYINGDIGYVIGANDDESVIVRFGKYDICINRQEMRNMELADAITIHKSQGSEFNHIHIILPEEAIHMMTRRILYTGVTRARETVNIYYTGDALSKAIDDAAEKRRVTVLRQRLIQAQQNEDNA